MWGRGLEPDYYHEAAIPGIGPNLNGWKKPGEKGLDPFTISCAVCFCGCSESDSFPPLRAGVKRQRPDGMICPERFYDLSMSSAVQALIGPTLRICLQQELIGWILMC